MKRLVRIIGVGAALCIILGAFVLGYYLGLQHERNESFLANSIPLYSQRVQSGNALHEYLKARFYWSSALVGDELFREHYRDYGPVNTNILCGMPYTREVDPVGHYRDFILRAKRLKVND